MSKNTNSVAEPVSGAFSTEAVEQLVWVQNLIGFLNGQFPADERWKAVFVERLAALPREAPVAVDEIITALYRRFKDWSKRGFGPDDVTWCEVKADVMNLVAAASPANEAGAVAVKALTLDEIWDDATNAVCQHMQDKGMCLCPDGDCVAAKVLPAPEDRAYFSSRALTASPASHGVVTAGRFLIERLNDFELGLDDPVDSREYAGHVVPALSRFRAALSPSLAEPQGVWQTMDTAPTDRKFDVWCTTPEGALGVRFTDVQWRGDGSGLGFVHHLETGSSWEYLEKPGIFPAWKPTHWRDRPDAPLAAAPSQEEKNG